MAFVVFNTENALSPTGDFVVADIGEHGFGFTDDTFDGSGAVGDHWWVHQDDRRRSGTERVSGYFSGEINTGDNSTPYLNITEWYQGLSGAFHYQTVKFPASGYDEYIVRGVGIGTLASPQSNLTQSVNNGYAFTGVMCHVDNNFQALDYQFAVVGHRGTSAESTVENKSTLNGSSSVTDEGDDVFGAGVTHGDLRIRLNSDNTIEFARSVLNADIWTVVNTPTSNVPTFGNTVCIGMIIYAEGTFEIPFTGSIDSFEYTAPPTSNGWLNRNYFWDNV